MNGLFGYKAFYNGKSIDLYAGSLYDAKLKAIALLRVKRKQQHMVSVVLCERDGEPVIHNPAEFG